MHSWRGGANLLSTEILFLWQKKYVPAHLIHFCVHHEICGTFELPSANHTIQWVWIEIVRPHLEQVCTARAPALHYTDHRVGGFQQWFLYGVPVIWPKTPAGADSSLSSVCTALLLCPFGKLLCFVILDSVDVTSFTWSFCVGSCSSFHILNTRSVLKLEICILWTAPVCRQYTL